MTEKFRPRLGTAVQGGAQLGWQLTLLYAFIFLFTAVVGSSLTILEFPPEEGLPGLLLANALCLMWAVLIFTSFFSLAAVVLGMATGLILEKWVGRLRADDPAAQGGWAGFLTACLILLAIQAFPYMWWKPQVQNIPPSTLWFWFIIPDILYLLSSSMAGWVIQRRRQNLVRPS